MRPRHIKIRLPLSPPCCRLRSPARAGTIDGLSPLPGYALPGYVIEAGGVDGDGATNRHKIDTQCSVTVTTAASYRIDWEAAGPEQCGAVVSSNLDHGSHQHGAGHADVVLENAHQRRPTTCKSASATGCG